MKMDAIIQARMSSQRYPGKVLHNVAGKPMLQYLLERLDHCHSLNHIVVATSTEDSDTPLADFCRQRGVECYRGPLVNVAGRFREVLDMYQFDGFVRVNGDSPLLDQQLIDKGVEIFLKGDFDLVTNVLPRTYPHGQSVEVMRADAFRQGYQSMQNAQDLEHVTRFFYKHQYDFRIHNFALEDNCSGMRFCVDTEQDLNVFTEMVARMEKPHWHYNLPEMIQIYSEIIQ